MTACRHSQPQGPGPWPVLCLVLWLLACAWPGLALARDTPSHPAAKDTAELPLATCTLKPHPDWSEPETWVWRQVCRGQVADFNRRYDKALDPAKPEQWTPAERRRRLLRPGFIDMILFKSPWRQALTRLGVIIKGAIITQDLKLHHGDISRPLGLVACRLEKNVHLAGCRTDHFMTFFGSVVVGHMNLVGLRAGPGLVLSRGRFSTIDLTSAQVQGNLEMQETTITGLADLAGVKVGRFLILRQGKFQQMQMYMAEVGLQVNLAQAVFQGILSMENLRVGGSIIMSGGKFQTTYLMTSVMGNSLLADKAVFSGDLKLDGAKVAQLLAMRHAHMVNMSMVGVEVSGELALNNSVFTGLVIMDGLRVKRLAHLGQAKFNILRLVGIRIGQELNLQECVAIRGAVLSNLRVGQNLSLRDVRFGECRLNQAEIGQTLILIGAKFQLLDLRGAKINTVWDGVEIGKTKPEQEPWATNLFMDGFTFQSLGGTRSKLGTPLALRPAEWYIQWLARQKRFSPLPYEHLASLLEQVGQPQEANDLRYARMERERRLARDTSFRRWLWLSVLKWAVGYGLGYRQSVAIVWMVLLVVVGAGVLWFAPEARRRGLLWVTALSFERLIPIEYFSKEFEEFDLKSWPKYYFIFFHQPAGYVLAFFVVASATGIIG